MSSEYTLYILTLASAREWEADALDEIWRETAHEEEARAAGTVLEDRRTPV